MDDLYGFLRYPRQEAPRESAPQRIKHWREYVRVMPDGQASRQAARCMDCGTPFCHTACPVNNLIPDWSSLVNDAHWRTAWEQLDSTNNFPEITGRLCPAPCEDACTLSIADHPVTIKSIELAVAERAWEQGWVQPIARKQQRRESITVIGSGPSGLACAQLLTRVGYQVRVLEKSDRIGGLLRYGIPDFRLQKEVLDRRLAQLKAEGVCFQTGVHAGIDIAVGELLASSAAIVLACGAEQPRQVILPGCESTGIYYALPYLKQQNKRVAGDAINPAERVTASGRDVVVIGGGDTGCDCVGTAIRQGARRVTQVQYHERPPLNADVLRHWPEPLPVLRTTDTEAEGCERLWGWDSVAFEENNGHVSAVLLQQLDWSKQQKGLQDRQHLNQPPRRLPAQLVLLAIGYAHPVHEGLLQQFSLELDGRGNVSADTQSYQTSVPGIFACGDMRRGQSLVVWAIREGRRCAHAVDEWLSGESELPCC